ncbi:ropporin-1-like protein isoform X1 [Scleropages formosus]|uniref:Ropporin-1-like protein n=1 Tax=Scleropages formosus TaxID=113540 RepID=A0A8C9SLI1_SCLFO|nr:ropporin-1-like protein isoform X1 [Scleropages formosus]
MSEPEKELIIPSELTEILQRFTKDAIRTQPEDLIQWSTSYFSALTQEKPLPVRGSPDTPTSVDLTRETLSAIHQEFQKRETVSRKELESMWKSFSLAEDHLQHILSVGCFREELEWMKFFALCCSYIGGTIKNAMAHICYILNSEPGCKLLEASVPYDTFRPLYTYLATMDGEVSEAQIDQALAYLGKKAKSSNGMVKVSDFIDTCKVRLG